MRNYLINHWMQDVDSLFRPFVPAISNWQEEAWFSPAVDVVETETEFLFQLDMPGLKEKDLNLTVKGRELLVTGERRKETTGQERDQKLHRSERCFGKFERSFFLPEEANLNKVEAKFKEGVLEIKVSKKEALQPKSIPIQSH